MKVIPHIYYKLEATDLLLPSDMKSREERGLSLKNIPAAAGHDDPFDWKCVMSNENKQKTTRELIKSVQDFCRTLHDISDEYSHVPYSRPTYKIRMTRNAMVFLHDNDLGGVSFTNRIKLTAANNGIFDFIYSRSNKLIYESNIREILGQNIQHIHVRQTSGNWYGYVAHNQESNDRVSNIKPDTPLYVYKFNDQEAFVEEIPNGTIIVNDNICQIYPEITKHIPAYMSYLFKNKTEPVKSR